MRNVLAHHGIDQIRAERRDCLAHALSSSPDCLWVLRSVKDFFTAEKKEAGAARLAAEKDALKLEEARKKVSRAACMQMRARASGDIYVAIYVQMLRGIFFATRTLAAMSEDEVAWMLTRVLTAHGAMAGPGAGCQKAAGNGTGQGRRRA